MLFSTDIYAENEKEKVADAEKKEFRLTIEALQTET